MTDSYRILLVGGGTGGHVYPLVAVAEEIIRLSQQNGTSVELRFAGDGDLLNQEAGALGIKSWGIVSPKWRRYFSILNFVDILKLPVGFLQSIFCIWFFMPDIIFAKGGYAAFLPSLAAKFMAIPIFIHETDAIPGATNKFLSKLSKKTFVALETTKQFFKTKNIEVVGNPIKRQIFQITERSSAVSNFNLDPIKPVVLITGASQGAQKINEVILLGLIDLIKSFQIIHQTGPKHFEKITKQVEQISKENPDSYGNLTSANYRAYPIFDASRMALAYCACDVIVSRSGSQIFETAAVGKPTVIVPLGGSSRNHQVANAREIAKFGAIVIEEENLTPHLLINEIKKAYDERVVLSEKIKQFARLDAASNIANQLLNFSK